MKLHSPSNVDLTRASNLKNALVTVRYMVLGTEVRQLIDLWTGIRYCSPVCIRSIVLLPASEEAFILHPQVQELHDRGVAGEIMVFDEA